MTYGKFGKSTLGGFGGSSSNLEKGILLWRPDRMIRRGQGARGTLFETKCLKTKDQRVSKWMPWSWYIMILHVFITDVIKPPSSLDWSWVVGFHEAPPVPSAPPNLRREPSWLIGGWKFWNMENQCPNDLKAYLTGPEIEKSEVCYHAVVFRS